MSIAECPICNEEKKLENHHKSYFPEVIEEMCHKCHLTLHREHPELCPLKEDGDRFYNRANHHTVTKSITLTNEEDEFLKKHCFSTTKVMKNAIRRLRERLETEQK